MTNLLLKVNVKCGGRNFKVLPHPSTFVGNKRCIFFGADVTHPDAGDADSPSLAAVVASNDWPDTGRFLALQSEQGHRVEILQNLQSQAEELMRKWSERNNFTAPDVCDHFSPPPFPLFFLTLPSVEQPVAFRKTHILIHVLLPLWVGRISYFSATVLEKTSSSKC